MLVTRPSDNAPLAGATVSIYNWNYNAVTFSASAVSDANGIATIVDPMPSSAPYSYISYGQWVSVQTADGQLAVLNTNSVNFDSQLYDRSATRVVATTDRNLYKEGDVVHVSGYVRAYDKSLNIQVRLCI